MPMQYDMHRIQSIYVS
uniref:Uncharacterized protein n=1 Tax=Arundo donax TaxID=35708 RepID=A0A0A9G3V1_ARUDO